MNNNFSDFLKVKPGDILWLTPEYRESSDSCAGIDEQELMVLVKAVHFHPSKKRCEIINLEFDETELRTPVDDDDIFIDRVEIHEYKGALRLISSVRIISSARIESLNEPTYYGDIKYSSAHIECKS